MPEYPKTNDHILITNLAGIFKVPVLRKSRTLEEAFEFLEQSPGLQVPFRCTDLIPVYEKFPVVPAVLQAKNSKLLSKVLLDVPGETVLVTDSVMTAGDTLFVAKLVDDGEPGLVITEWVNRMSRHELLVGPYEEFTIIAAPLRAFAN